ncbi:uncharacterized protein LOC126844704 isoform X2 [Adelges cooleyi]|uniref:uncharacterized protein LOC126844704 isoform X2 n=2 Tax=Adelges cooleyi TaxID=133065 RepID=UPI00217F2CB6|nr:uncharacterized protein LOC126844704 isoform X2 [Adelges cooleyi]
MHFKGSFLFLSAVVLVVLSTSTGVNGEQDKELPRGGDYIEPSQPNTQSPSQFTFSGGQSGGTINNPSVPTATGSFTFPQPLSSTVTPAYPWPSRHNNQYLFFFHIYIAAIGLGHISTSGHE